MTRLAMAMLFAWTLGWSHAWSQEASSVSFGLSGEVVDTRGNTLPGATILVQGATSLGTSTDATGRFRIDFPHAGPWQLVVSFVGYEAQTLSLSFDSPTMFQRIRLKQGFWKVIVVVVIIYSFFLHHEYVKYGII